MYHIGRAEAVVRAGRGVAASADSTVQVAIRMWDDNLLMLHADPKIARELKEGDYVIADYTPVKPESPHRKMVIVKILRGKEGKELYERFTEEFQRKKNKEAQPPAASMPYIR